MSFTRLVQYKVVLRMFTSIDIQKKAETECINSD